MCVVFFGCFICFMMLLLRFSFRVCLVCCFNVLVLFAVCVVGCFACVAVSVF